MCGRGKYPHEGESRKVANLPRQDSTTSYNQTAECAGRPNMGVPLQLRTVSVRFCSAEKHSCTTPQAERRGPNTHRGDWHAATLHGQLSELYQRAVRRDRSTMVCTVSILRRLHHWPWVPCKPATAPFPHQNWITVLDGQNAARMTQQTRVPDPILCSSYRSVLHGQNSSTSLQWRQSTMYQPPNGFCPCPWHRHADFRQ